MAGILSPLYLSPKGSHEPLLSPSSSSSPSRVTRRFSRRSPNLVIIGLVCLLILDHFYPNLLHSDRFALSSLADLRASYGLQTNHVNETLLAEIEAEEQEQRSISHAALDARWAEVAERHKWAMENVTITKDVGGFANRVKALIALQELSDEFEEHAHASNHYSDESGVSDWVDRRRSMQVQHDQLFARLFPFVNKSKKRTRTFAELRKGYTRPRGIIVPCGNQQFQMAVHLISTLKHVHKSPLPIQVVYSGGGDLDQYKRAAFRAISPDVETVDLANFFDEEEVGIVNGGWAIKAFALLASPFQEVIIMDADAVFFQPPEVMFDYPMYNATGTLYFRDREIFAGDGEVHRWWGELMESRKPSEELLKSKFYTEMGSREEMESGVVVYDKRRREVMMGLLMVAHMNIRKVRDLVTYQITHGDKESFWMAFELVSVPYAFSSVDYAPIIGQLTHPDTHFHSINSRICSDHLLHLDATQKRPLWFNGSLFQEKAFKNKGWFFATHWAAGTGDWECDPQPWCMKSIREVDVHKLADVGYDEILTKMIGTALYWESQFPGLVDKHY